MARLPIPGSDNNTWGEILNEFLKTEHNPDGTLKKSADIEAAQSLANNASDATQSIQTELNSHTGDTSNPHQVSKIQIGLGNITNDTQIKLSDLDIDPSLSGNSDTKVPSQKAVKTYVDNAPGASLAWGNITGVVTNQTDLQTAIDLKLDKNAVIPGATKTKITYDSQGLVTAGADATTADIVDSSNKRYVTDAQLTVLSNTSGSNTGDQDLSGLVPVSRTINGHSLNTNIAVTKSDIGLSNVTNVAQVEAATTGVKLWHGPETAYSALGTYDPNTVYVVMED